MAPRDKAAGSGPVRRPAARGFYPGDCRAQLSAFLVDSHPPADLTHPLLGAALPHAGWMYSGRTAALTLDCFQHSLPPETVVLFGAVHTAGISAHSVYRDGTWETPLGNLPVDHHTAEAILTATGEYLQADYDAHMFEHSIEVLTPMVKVFFPEAAIVPIMVLPEQSAVRLGTATAAAVSRREQRTVFLASSDLTHYGFQFGFTPEGTGPEAKAWMEDNDHRLIDTLCSATGEKVLDEVLVNHNACGAGALAALKGAMTTLGRPKGRLISYTTSFDVDPEPVFRHAVGYAGVVF